jgi:hypothetical protein
MAVITKHELDVTEQGQVTQMIREAVASGQGVPWDGHDDDGVWSPGLADFVPMLTATGYYPQDQRNDFDNHPARTLDCPEFARQVALVLDVLASCPKQPGGASDTGCNSCGIAEAITLKTGQSMSVGAVVLAALAAGFTLTTVTGYADELFVAGLLGEALRFAVDALSREVAHA